MPGTCWNWLSHSYPLTQQSCVVVRASAVWNILCSFSHCPLSYQEERTSLILHNLWRADISRMWHRMGDSHWELDSNSLQIIRKNTVFALTFSEGLNGECWAINKSRCRITCPISITCPQKYLFHHLFRMWYWLTVSLCKSLYHAICEPCPCLLSIILRDFYFISQLQQLIKQWAELFPLLQLVLIEDRRSIKHTTHQRTDKHVCHVTFLPKVNQ